MNRDFLFFKWGLTESKRDYSYVIMQEAIKNRMVRLYTGPHFLRNPKIASIHAKLCKTYPYLAKLNYRFYLPKEIYKKETNIFLFNEWHPCLVNLEFFPWLKKRFGCKTVLILRNMIVNKKYPMVNGVDLHKLKEIFDLIVTNEIKDAKEYDLFFLPNPFSSIYDKKVKIEYDICFVGKNKGRERMLMEIAKKANENNAIWNFKIVEKARRISVLEYTDYQPYTEIIKQDMQSNCILEIIQPGQSSYTLRFQEAICLGKKLLTNNKEVKNEKYYDPKYIQVFERPEEINWDFVKERIQVDYNYHGEYSPIVFLEKIKRRLEQENNDGIA